MWIYRKSLPLYVSACEDVWRRVKTRLNERFARGCSSQLLTQNETCLVDVLILGQNFTSGQLFYQAIQLGTWHSFTCFELRIVSMTFKYGRIPVDKKIHWYLLQIKHLTAPQKMPNLNKAFHSPEFRAKLLFTRHWVGGFYWDSLLIEHSMDKIYNLGPKICNPHRGDFTVLKAVRELRQSVLLDAFTRNFSLL